MNLIIDKPWKDKSYRKRVDLYFDFIKHNFCIDCYKYDKWDEIKQSPIVTPSHVLAKGSTRRNDHFDNLIPQCLKCHEIFERKSPEERLRLHGQTAIDFTIGFNERYPL